MKTLFYLLFIIAPLLSFSQIKTEASFEGKSVHEWVYNYKKKDYELVSKSPLDTKIIISETAIWFRKGIESDWLENTWFFDAKTTADNETEIHTYYDERDQKVEVDLGNHTITYYYEYNNKTKVYENFAVYLNLVQNDKILAAFYKRNETINLNKIVLNFTLVKSNLDEKKDSNERHSFILNYMENGDVYHYIGKHNFEVYKKVDFESTKDEDGDEVYKLIVRNNKGEQFNVLFFDEEYEVIGIEKEKETLFFTN